MSAEIIKELDESIVYIKAANHIVKDKLKEKIDIKLIKIETRLDAGLDRLYALKAKLENK